MKHSACYKMALGLAALAACLLLAGCAAGAEKEADMSFKTISAEEAKALMDTTDGYVLLDVRTEEEYASGHIPGAVCIPDYELADRAAQELPQRENLILVYCRTGRRSKSAAETLASLGYSNVQDFGGILDWPYDTE